MDKKQNDNLLNFSEKAKIVSAIVKQNLSSSEQNIANLLAFCVWSEIMPCQQNLPETITYINLYYSVNQFDLLTEVKPTSKLESLFTNTLYTELLQNLQGLKDINCQFAINCIVCAKFIKNKNTKIAGKYLNLLKKDEFFKYIFVETMKSDNQSKQNKA